MKGIPIVRANGLQHLCGLIAMSFMVASCATAGSFTVLTYNVAGLPPLVQARKDDPRLSPLNHIPLIADRFDATVYDVVAFQEGFVQDPNFDNGPPYDDTALSVGTLFYDQLTANPGTPAFAQIAPRDAVGMSGNLPRVASGLGRLSTTAFTGYARDRWDQTAGADALSDKGYAFARHRLAEGVFVDIYNWHANAGSDVSAGGPAARADNVEELIKAINANSRGNAVIVLGDTNTLYPRTIDTLRRLLGLVEGPVGSENLHPPLEDVWIELARGGVVPEQDDVRLDECDGERGQAGADCEHRDKILYRSGRDVVLRARKYVVEEDFVVPGSSTQLSDHWPVGARFNFALRYNRRIPNLSGRPKADLTIRRGRTLLVDTKTNGGSAERLVRYGRAQDEILVGQMDRDRRAELVIRRGRTYLIDLRNNGGHPERVIKYGKSDDTVFMADLDGDGIDNLVIRRGSRYLIDSSNDGRRPEAVIRYGRDDDIVFFADLDGNGTHDLVIRRGNRYLVDTGNDGRAAERVLKYGRSQDIVFVADMDGNGSDDLVIRRGSHYLADTGNDGGVAELTLRYRRHDDEVLVGDMDGNGADELIVRRGNRYRIDIGNDGGRPERIIAFGRDKDVLLLQ
jgi:hypothetical protein